MDQPEHPGIGPPEAPPFRRFPRLMPHPAVRRLTPGRMLLAGLGVFCALALAALALAQLRDRARRYVDARNVYRLTSQEIILEPPPPPWYRGGSAAFLEHALGGDPDFQSFSALDFDPTRLLLRIRLYPWVDKALRVEVGHPNRVVVRLGYRDPVAVERRTDATDHTVVDREGVILPRGDIDFERAGPLVKLFGFDPPADPHDGRVWDRVDPKHGVVVRDERVRTAARLAGFLRNELRREAGKEPAFRFVAIHPWGDDGYSVQVGANLTFKWDEPGTADAAGRWSDAAKWAMVLDRIRSNPPVEGGPWIELKFTGDGVQVDDVHNAPRQATQREPNLPLHRAKRTQSLDP